MKNFNYNKVIFLIGNSHHSDLNSNPLEKALSYNFFPLKNSIEFFIKKKVKKIVIFSGALIYGNKNLKLPVDEKQQIDGFQNNYLFSKYLAEQLAHFYRKKIKIINVRLSNIYGPTLLERPDLVQEILNKILLQNKKKIEVKSFIPQRDFIYAEDAAEAVIKLLKSNFSGNINLGSGKIHSVKTVCNIISKYTGAQIKSQKKKVSGQMKFVFNTNKLRNLINWKTNYTLDEGIKLTINKILRYKDEVKK